MQSIKLLNAYKAQTNMALFAKYKDRDGNIYIDEKELEEVCCDCRGNSYSCSDIGGYFICFGAACLGFAEYCI